MLPLLQALPSGTPAQRTTKAVQIFDVVQRFTRVCTALALTIVRELGMAHDARTIAPVRAGGVAGGEK